MSSADVIIHKFNNHLAYVETNDTNVLSLIYSALSFYKAGYMHTPAFKARIWDGMIHMFNTSSRTFPLGLAKFIVDTLDANKFKVIADDEVVGSFLDKNYKEKNIMDFINNHKFYSHGKRIYPRDDQKAAVCRAIRNKRCINICPTSFGKSLSITIECLYYISKIKRCIIIVPTKALVEQFVNDIKDYATNEDGELEDWFPNMQSISSTNPEINDDTELVVSTWQMIMSIYKNDPEYINNFDVIILDECHNARGASITKILTSAVNVEYRTGWTGTLPSDETERMMIVSLFGLDKDITTTKKLMDDKIVANLRIIMPRLIYPDEVRHDVVSLNYQNEIKYLERCNGRNFAIAKFVGTMKQTGIVFYKRIKHGETLRDIFRYYFPDRNIYFVHSSYFEMNGEMFKTLEDLKPFIEKDPNGIVIANFQLASTGLSIKNLHYVMYATPIDSVITTLQSIGRGLRVSDTKKSVILIDPIDDFTYSTKRTEKQNYAIKHFKDRYEIYRHSNFNVTFINVNVDLFKGDENVYDVVCSK